MEDQERLRTFEYDKGYENEGDIKPNKLKNYLRNRKHTPDQMLVQQLEKPIPTKTKGYQAWKAMWKNEKRRKSDFTDNPVEQMLLIEQARKDEFLQQRRPSKTLHEKGKRLDQLIEDGRSASTNSFISNPNSIVKSEMNIREIKKKKHQKNV